MSVVELLLTLSSIVYDAASSGVVTSCCGLGARCLVYKVSLLTLKVLVMALGLAVMFQILCIDFCT